MAPPGFQFRIDDAARMRIAAAVPPVGGCGGATLMTYLSGFRRAILAPNQAGRAEART